ncbi:MAG: hypothetical protein ABI665_04820 [Vicinamibacterales bacterium]
MYELLRKHFNGTDRARFESDLAEKETVIVLRDGGSDIRGFSTLMRTAVRVQQQDVVAFFSGDTIVDPAYWGDTALSRFWGQVVFGEARRLAALAPEARIFWFLICSGYRTWRFLPVFFREFYPNAAAPTPPFFQQLLDTLGLRKFGDQYVPGAGIVRFRQATPLRPGVAEVTQGRLRDPQVAFFVRANPGHAEGDELACVAELSRANLTRAGLRMVDS